ncbi:MAG: hypothetical protein RIB93_11070 [Coleofasciculus sp. D1-CHI-01]
MEAIEIAATQTKSACADWIITGVANPDLVLIIIAAFCIDGNSAIALINPLLFYTQFLSIFNNYTPFFNRFLYLFYFLFSRKDGAAIAVELSFFRITHYPLKNCRQKSRYRNFAMEAP